MCLIVLEGLRSSWTALPRVQITSAAGEVAVAAVGGAVDVDGAELDAARDGVEFGGDDAFARGEAFVDEFVEGVGDGGGAEDELFQGWGGAVDNFAGGFGEGAVEEGVGFVEDQVLDAREDVGFFLGDAGDEMGGGDKDVDAVWVEEAIADDGRGVAGGDACGAVFDGVGEGFDHFCNLGD